MRHAVLAFLALAWATPVAVAADETERCASLPTPAERIVCYDRQFPPEHPSAATAVPPTAAPPSSPASPVAELVPVAPAPQSPQADDNNSWTHGLFAKPDQINVASTIKAMHRRDTQNMIFLLANDEIWMQDSVRSLPFKVGDTVRIKNGTFGGYFLTSDSGTKTRVRRIK
ncbi:MAG: hypothetical protein HC809_01490 [Gammaproteobacteria bacterium]|nr:hypothetical protein [Gammaproteobacteria bacterium]